MFNYKIAIISDIHGNLTALRAAMRIIDYLKVDEIYCLGDLVGKGAFPSEVIDICRERCAAVTLGNHEDFFLKDPDVDYYRWARNILSEEQISWMAGLPLYKDLYLSGRKIRLCHADPQDVHRRIYSRETPNIKETLFRPLGPEDHSPDIFCYGDIHYAYTEYFRQGRTLINAGSVGNPMDIPQACFLLLRGSAPGEASPGVPLPLGIEFIRLPYDAEEEITKTLSSSMPERGREIYINELRTAVHGKRWSEHS